MNTLVNVSLLEEEFVYFKEFDGKIIILLAGGDKSTQQKDIEKAKEILKRIKQ